MNMIWLLQWAVSFQQRLRRRRLFEPKAEFSAYCAQIASAGPGYMCASKQKSLRGGTEEERYLYLAAGG